MIDDEIDALAGRLMAGEAVDRDELATAVRAVLTALSTLHRGKAAELRVAPFGAVQILDGHIHRRGTPSTVVSFDPTTFLGLWSGRITTEDALEASGTRASGSRSLDVLQAVSQH